MGPLLLLALIVLLIIAGVAVLDLALAVIWYLAIGLVVGAVARLVVPGTQNMGWLATSVAGLFGAMIGGGIAEAASLATVWGIVFSVAAAAIAVAIYGGTTAGTDAAPHRHV